MIMLIAFLFLSQKKKSCLFLFYLKKLFDFSLFVELVGPAVHHSKVSVLRYISVFFMQLGPCRIRNCVYVYIHVKKNLVNLNHAVYCHPQEATSATAETKEHDEPKEKGIFFIN